MLREVCHSQIPGTQKQEQSMGCNHSKNRRQCYKPISAFDDEDGYSMIASAVQSPLVARSERALDVPGDVKHVAKISFDRHYQLLEVLGEGGYSIVRHVRCKSTGNAFCHVSFKLTRFV